MGHRCETLMAAEAENKSDNGWVKVSGTSPGSSPGSAEAPVRARCPRQAPGACSTERHTRHTALLWDGFAIFLTGHDISLGLAAEKSVWQPPADTFLGNTNPAISKARDCPPPPPTPFPTRVKKFASTVWWKKEPRAAGGKLRWALKMHMQAQTLATLRRQADEAPEESQS